MKKTILVCGAGGFIGHHLVKRLKSEGHTVIGADVKYPDYEKSEADEFLLGDLTLVENCKKAVSPNGKAVDEIYQLAANMGGAGFIFTGEHDDEVMHNSVLINLHILHEAVKAGVKKVFYSSSACMYPAYNQMDPNNPKCSEDSAYPAAPDSEYGWEKLFSERLYLTYAKLNPIEVRIARYHNIYGPLGTWQGGREKAPAAICRKVALCENNGTIEIWGDGLQTRSFLFIEDCVDATRLLMDSVHTGPVNIGSEEMVTINQLVDIAASVAKKKIHTKHIDGPLGVRGRNSDNALIEQYLNWKPKYTLQQGIQRTYDWIVTQIEKSQQKAA
jgi:nucleoside-diphosphate-sugar epimerase